MRLQLWERDYTSSLKGTQMSTTSDRLGAQANKLSEDLQEMGGVVRTAAQEKLEQVRENANEYYQQRREKVHGTLCDFEQYIREQPVKSVLIAAGIGLLFGRFWMRR
jgi:ElaB/YqjD/DUF883 family membrane-anchored ribosome-binding protein